MTIARGPVRAGAFSLLQVEVVVAVSIRAGVVQAQAFIQGNQNEQVSSTIF